jgi:hypothetical protein
MLDQRQGEEMRLNVQLIQESEALVFDIFGMFFVSVQSEKVIFNLRLLLGFFSWQEAAKCSGVFGANKAKCLAGCNQFQLR